MIPNPPPDSPGTVARLPHFALRRRAGALALYGLASLIASLHATPRPLVLGPVRGLGVDATPQSFNASHETLAGGDINNDGLGDVVAISTGWNGSPRVSVALGQPGHSFISGPAVGETGNYGGVALHDINHDGNLDLLLAEFDAGELRIRTGNGDGTFNAPTNYPAPGVRARSIRVADFDGDGNIDVAMNTEGGGIRIFHFNANGLLTSTRDVITASGIGFMETGDFDADGAPDLVFAPYSSEQMFFLTELRTASPRTTGLTVSGYSGITGLRTGNLPGNAPSAVVFASASSNKAAVLPDLEPGTSLFEFAHNRARQALLTDLNGDDLPDLLIVGDDPANPNWRNNQQIEFRAFDGVSFGDPQIIKTGLSQVTWVTTRDMNDDGLEDVLIAQDGGSSFIIFNETPLPPRLVSPGDATFEVGEAGSFQVEASGHGNITYSLAAGTLPVGMSLNASGLLSGTPAVGTEGDHVVTFAADNGVPPAATQAFTLTVIPRKLPVITSPSLAGVTSHTAQMGASIGNDWGLPITRRGFVYSLTDVTGDPKLGGGGVTVVDDPNPSIGGFNTTVLDLVPSARYSFAAFAENARGVAHTQVVHFQTLALPGSGSLVVTTATDEDNGSSDPSAGTGTSLREAVAYANALGGTQTITFSPNLFISGPAILPLALGQLWYDSPVGQLTIQGPGADRLTLDGGGTTRLFWHNSGSLTISGMAFSGGRASSSSSGGAIRSAGLLRLTDCYFHGNSATSAGGAVYSLGECIVERCTFLANSVTATGGNSGHGGAIASENRLFVYNSTFHDNHAMHDTGDQGGTGGAISHPFGGGIFRITNATITGNSANVDGGGVYSNGVSMAIRNTIISGNTAPANANANIPGANVSNSLIDVDPATIFATGLPADHGGAMPTIALKRGGPAIDSGDNALATDLNLNPFATDQRGVARIVHGAVDIGAYEYVQTPAVAAAGVSAITDTGATLGGEVSDDGHGQVRRGFVFARTAENPAPSIGGVGVTEIEVAGTTGVFDTALGGLLPLTEYSFAAFAENEAGTAYSTVVTFRTTETPSLVVTLGTDTVNPSDGQTSLREALSHAASLGGPPTITFALALSGQTITLGSELAISTEVVIQGPGALQLTISGGNANRAFRVTATGVATVSGLTIANGRVDVASYPEGNGGGILNQGNLTLLDSVLSNNQAGGTHLGHGGGLHHAGSSLVVTRCTFSGNRTAAGGFGGGMGVESGTVQITSSTFTGNSALANSGNGGAICNFAGDTQIANSTFSGNSAGNGGAIIHYGGTMSCQHCTIAQNAATYTGGGIERVGRAGNDLFLQNTLIALNTAPAGPDAYSYTDLNSGAFTSLGHNLLGNANGALGLGATGDLLGSTAVPIEPRLGPLANNGGPTATHALLAGSPAINAAGAGTLLTDQRGFPRQATTGGGLPGRYYALSSPATPALLAPLSNLEALTPGAVVFTPRVDFGSGTETTPGDGSVLDRNPSDGNLFGGLGVSLGENNLAALWDGLITVPETADYRFTTRSDDGSVLYVDGALVVDNNALQGMSNASGTIHLAAGAHRLTIAYFEAGGGAGMQASWEQITGNAPFARQVIPAAVLSSGSPPDIGAVEDTLGDDDPDGDTLRNAAEALAGSNPLKLDSDNDGFNDATEQLNGSDPSSAASVPPITHVERVLGFGPARGLDLSGDFRYAFNIGTPGVAGQAGDANFTADNAPGISVSAPNEIADWTIRDFGNAPAEDALETVYRSIRWANRDHGDPALRTLRVDLANLVPGRHYKLQLLFGEAWAYRRLFDILVNGVLVLPAFDTGAAQGLDSGAHAASAVVHEFIATDPTLHLVLDGANTPGDIDGNPILNGVTLERIPHPEVEAQWFFYNHSMWDGNNAGADASDDNAIAPDKGALLPGGVATYANYTSYSRGLNGIMVDIADLPGTPTASDFTFKVGNDNTPSAWAGAPEPAFIDVRPGAGANGSNRITLIWNDNNLDGVSDVNEAVAKAWLEVTVLATANTGLSADHTFYFGNAVGEVGNSANDALVDAIDVYQPYYNQTPGGLAPITSPYDVNRDRTVDAIDVYLPYYHQTGGPTALVLLNLSGAGLLSGNGGSGPAVLQVGSPLSQAGMRQLLSEGRIDGLDPATGRPLEGTRATLSLHWTAEGRLLAALEAGPGEWRLEWTGDLAAGEWQPVVRGWGLEATGQGWWLDWEGETPARFYRVVEGGSQAQ